MTPGSPAASSPHAQPPAARDERPRDAQAFRKLLVVLPTWFGDCLMATPTLRALREACPQAHITGLVAGPLVPLMQGAPGVDQWRPALPKAGPLAAGQQAKALRDPRFDAAVLLPNSFRWAWIAKRAGIPVRIGYARDARGPLLTDRLVPRRVGRRLLEVPTLEYYLQIARYLGATGDDPTMHLPVDADADRQARDLLHQANDNAPDDHRPLLLFNPGAQNPEKRWPAERFAQLADRCANQLQARVALTGSPAERPILHAVHAAANTPLLDLPKLGIDLPMLKAVTRRAAVLVTNDTGPRHLAAAVNTPVVTLFGPTTPAWTHIQFPRERILSATPDASPGPITNLTVDAVFHAVADQLTDHAHHPDDDEYAAQHDFHPPNTDDHAEQGP